VGNTDNYAIPYPEQHDIPDGAGQMKSLADRVDEVLKPIADNVVANSAAITTIDTRTTDSGNKDTIAFTPATGWGTVVASGRRFGPLCVVHWVATRTGTAIAAVASGNIPDTLVLTITEPTFIPHYSVYSGFGANQGSAGRFFLGTPSGALYISQYAPGIAINTNDILNGTIVYVGN
jgi:hypothetical protein